MFRSFTSLLHHILDLSISENECFLDRVYEDELFFNNWLVSGKRATLIVWWLAIPELLFFVKDEECISFQITNHTH